MASPIAAPRQPLSALDVNTTYYPSMPPTTNTTLTSIKPLQLLSQKRPHSQISGGSQENILSTQTQICKTVTSPRQTKEQSTALRQRTTTKGGIPLSHAQAQGNFKLPLPRTRVTIATRQRQETHDPRAQEPIVQEDKEMEEWRKSTKSLFERSTFYFDGCDTRFQEQASAILPKMGSKVSQFFSNSVTIVVTTREIPSPSMAGKFQLEQAQPEEAHPQPEETPQQETQGEPTQNDLLRRAKPVSKRESYQNTLNMIHPRFQLPEELPAKPARDILLRARDLGMRIWTCEKFKKILRALALPTTPPSTQPTTINPLHLSAALKAEKRHGRTTETDPSVPREEYVYFQGPFILVTDKAQVHKPIIVREYPAGSERDDARWPMFWATKEGSCPFIKPSHPVRPVVKPPVLGESKVVNRRMPTEQPASGIVNSSNAFSAIRSTTTCGSNLTSATAITGISTGIVTRQVRGLETRLTSVIPSAMPPPKKRRMEVLKKPVVKKKEKKDGYCENCKDRYDDYDEHCESRKHRKYARNNKNFVELDNLLKLLERPLIKEEEDYRSNYYS